MITIYTQAYNTKSYIRQCVESVLNQTYRDFEYILVDNGCTDGTSEILREYAARDERIRLTSFEENKKDLMLKIVPETANGKFFTVLDSDDWWELDYLEMLIGFLKASELDLVLTGTINYFEQDSSSSVMRKLDHPAIFTQRQFAQQYPFYWDFSSTNWGNIMRMELFRKAQFPKKRISYGGDTINMLKYIEQCDRIGIDNLALYHYRIRENSVSSEYDAQRFPSNVLLYNCISDFLNKHNTFDTDKQEWLKRVHANSIRMTAEMLSNSKISPDEKLCELRKITEHPLTKATLSVKHPKIDLMRITLLAIAFQNAGTSIEIFDEVTMSIIPNCAPAISAQCAQFLALKPELLNSLARDDPYALLSALLDMLRTSEQTKKYDLAAMIRALSSDKPLLKDIDDKKFLRRHGDIYLAVWRGQYTEALDVMTGLLLNGEKADETFLQLYLNLAALQNQPSAFVFGKIRLAQMYLRKGDKEVCRAVLKELDEMGVEKNNEILEIKNALN